MTEAVPVVMINHVSIAIAAAPDTVWQLILEDYVEARKFRETGTLEPIDAPGAILAYRLRAEHDGGLVDERVVRITERDESARRLSAAADYLSVPGGMQVYATYHAQEAADGTRYAIDCHTSVRMADAGSGIAATLAAATAEADRHLLAYLANVKARAEARD